MSPQTTYLDVKAVCKLTGLSDSFVRDAISKGHLTAFKIGANLRIRHEDVVKWVEADAVANT